MGTRKGNMQFRGAMVQDFEDCSPLLQQLWSSINLNGPAANSEEVQEIKSVFCQLLEEPDAKVIIAEENGQIIAFLDLTFRKTLFHRGWTMIIEDLIVDEAHRRKGIGKQLVKFSEHMREKGDVTLLS